MNWQGFEVFEQLDNNRSAAQLGQLAQEHIEGQEGQGPRVVRLRLQGFLKFLKVAKPIKSAIKEQQLSSFLTTLESFLCSDLSTRFGGNQLH